MSWGEVKYAINDTLGTDKFNPLNRQITKRPVETKSGLFSVLDKGKQESRVDTLYETSPSSSGGMHTKDALYFVYRYTTGSSYNYRYLAKYEAAANKTVTVASQREDATDKWIWNMTTTLSYYSLNEDELYFVISNTAIRKMSNPSVTVVTLPETPIAFAVNGGYVYYLTSSKLKKYNRADGNVEEVSNIYTPLSNSTSSHHQWSYENFWYYIGTNRKIYKINMETLTIQTIDTNLNTGYLYYCLTDYKHETVLFIRDTTLAYTFNCKTERLNECSYPLSIPSLLESENQIGSSDPKGFINNKIILTNTGRTTGNRTYGYHAVRRWDVNQVVLENRIIFLLKSGFKIKRYSDISLYNPIDYTITTLDLPSSEYIATSDEWIIDDGKWYMIEEAE